MGTHEVRDLPLPRGFERETRVEAQGGRSFHFDVSPDEQSFIASRKICVGNNEVYFFSVGRVSIIALQAPTP